MGVAFTGFQSAFHYNSNTRGFAQLMLPKENHMPAEFAQFAVHESITLAVEELLELLLLFNK